MRRLRNLLLANGLIATMVFLLAASSPAAADDDQWGWDYCAPPYPPKCAQSTAEGRRVNAACERDVDFYIAAVFRYRTCLANEMERAVREANKTAQTVKCPKDNHYCFGLSR